MVAVGAKRVKGWGGARVSDLPVAARKLSVVGHAESRGESQLRRMASHGETLTKALRAASVGTARVGAWQGGGV